MGLIELQRQPDLLKSAPKQPSRGSARPSDSALLSAWIKRGQSDVFTVTTNLTPDLARLILQRNDANRPVTWSSSTRSVSVYADAMRRGEWVLNGETIVMSRCGQLNDGQHRCYAVIEAGVAVPVQITFGVERDTRHTVDQGIARSPGHILAMSGEVNTNQLACELQLLWCVDNELTPNARPSMDQMLDTLGRHPGSRDAVTATRTLWGHYRLSGGYIAGAHYLCRRVDEYLADQFLHGVATGLNIQSATSPVARLRKQYEEHSAKRKLLRRDEQAALYIKAFNMFVRGRSGPVQWRNSGPAAEAFPLPNKRG